MDSAESPIKAMSDEEKVEIIKKSITKLASKLDGGDKADYHKAKSMSIICPRNIEFVQQKIM